MELTGIRYPDPIFKKKPDPGPDPAVEKKPNPEPVYDIILCKVKYSMSQK